MTLRAPGLVLLTALALSGCATTPPPPAPPVERGAALPIWLENALRDPARPAADMARGAISAIAMPSSE
jgi:hypothetical protein